MSDEHEADFGLVMPFVVVVSHGGPYEDAAFAAGWECGRIDEALTDAQRRHAQSMSFPIVRAADELEDLRRGATEREADA